MELLENEKMIDTLKVDGHGWIPYVQIKPQSQIGVTVLQKDGKSHIAVHHEVKSHDRIIGHSISYFDPGVSIKLEKALAKARKIVEKENG